MSSEGGAQSSDWRLPSFLIMSNRQNLLVLLPLTVVPLPCRQM
jgi:hypothetical protein